jgi:hypothetical protein
MPSDYSLVLLPSEDMAICFENCQYEENEKGGGGYALNSIIRDFTLICIYKPIILSSEKR